MLLGMLSIHKTQLLIESHIYVSPFALENEVPERPTEKTTKHSQTKEKEERKNHLK